MRDVQIILPSGYIIEGVRKISFELFNSIFDQDVLRGSYTPAITIPATDNNRVALGFSDKPGVTTMPSRSIPNVTAWVAGQYLDCTLKIVNATDSTYVGSLLMGWGTMVEAMSKTLLSELQMPAVPLVSSPVLAYDPEDMISDNWDEYQDYLSALRERLVEINDDPGSVVFPYLVFGNDNVILSEKNNIKVDFDGTINSQGIYHPAVFLKKILTEGFANFGKVVSGAFLEDEDISRVLVISDRDIYRRYIDGGNDWVRYPASLLPKNCLPKVSCLEFIKKLKATFWLPIDVSYFRKTLKIRTWDEVFDGTVVIDWTDKVEGSSLVDIRNDIPVGFKTEYWLNQPDDFYNKVVQGFSEKTIRPTVATFADLPTSPMPETTDIRFVTSLGFFFAANLSDDGSAIDAERPWIPYAYDIRDFGIGNQGDTRTVILPTLDDCRPVDYLSFDSDQWGLVTRYFGFENTGEQFQGPYFFNTYEKQGEQGKQIRISFWMGKSVVQEFVTDNPHRYTASSVGTIPDSHWFPQISDLGETEFTLFQTTGQGKPRTSKNGLYQKFGSRIYDFLSKTKKVRFRVNLEEPDLIQIDNTLKYRIGDEFYYLDTIRGSFPVMQSSEVEAWWIPPGF